MGLDKQHTEKKDTAEKRPGSSQYALNVTLAAVAGQVGCLTIVIIFVALFAGLWLDNQFGTKPSFTVGLMVASVPVTLVTMFWVVRQATSRIQNKPQDSQRTEEEAARGRDS